MWHALQEEEGIRKGNSLRSSPIPASQTQNALKHIVPGMNIEFLAFYRDKNEQRLLEDALLYLEVDLKLPPSATTPILRVGRATHCDTVFLVERGTDSTAINVERLGKGTFALKRDPTKPPFIFTCFIIPQ
jgi:hypothetical protein